MVMDTLALEPAQGVMHCVWDPFGAADRPPPRPGWRLKVDEQLAIADADENPAPPEGEIADAGDEMTRNEGSRMVSL